MSLTLVYQVLSESRALIQRVDCSSADSTGSLVPAVVCGNFSHMTGGMGLDLAFGGRALASSSRNSMNFSYVGVISSRAVKMDHSRKVSSSMVVSAMAVRRCPASNGPYCRHTCSTSPWSCASRL